MPYVTALVGISFRHVEGSPALGLGVSRGWCVDVDVSMEGVEDLPAGASIGMTADPAVA